jgi:hypothetical protein
MEQDLDRSLAKVQEHLSAPDREALLKELEETINWMILHRFDALVQVLYRMDVDEKKLRTMLEQPGDTDAARIIATLLLERQLQKLHTRRQFRRDTDIPEEDKW